MLQCSTLATTRGKLPLNYYYVFLCVFFFLFKSRNYIVNWMTMTRKSGEPLYATYGNTGQLVLTLLSFISSVYHDPLHWRSNQRPQNAEPNVYHCAINPHRTQAKPNQQVTVIARPINLNVSCKLYPYSLQRTRSPPGPRLPRRIGNTH